MLFYFNFDSIACQGKVHYTQPGPMRVHFRALLGLLVGVVLSMLTLFSFYSLDQELTKYPPFTEEGARVLHSFWTGDVDPDLVLCWYAHHLNPEIHQIFHVENIPDWTEATKQYPFLSELDIQPLDWRKQFSSLGVKWNEGLLRHLPQLQVSTRSDIFRYSLILQNEDIFYADADVCLLNLQSQDLNLLEKEFVVQVPRVESDQSTALLVNNGLFKFHHGSQLFRKRLADAFGSQGAIGSLTASRDHWGVVGPNWFATLLDGVPKTFYPTEKERDDFSLLILETEFGFGWSWNERELSFCDVWESQLANKGLAIHLWRDRRKEYSEQIKEVTDLALEKGYIPSLCPH